MFNAPVNLKSDLTNEEIIHAISEIEAKIKKAAPKVDMIFLETASLTDSSVKKMMPHISVSDSRFKIQGFYLQS